VSNMAEEPEGMEADVVIEDMDQTSLTSSAPTSVIVNVTGENATGDSEMDRTASPISHSPSNSTQFQAAVVGKLLAVQRLAGHNELRQTYSEPGLKKKVQRVKQHNRLSPVSRRTDLNKTLSVGSSLDSAAVPGSSGSSSWRQSTSASSLYTSPRSPSSSTTPHCESPSSQYEEGGAGGRAEEMSGITMATQIPPGLAAAARFPTVQMTPLLTSGVIPTQEQLEAFQKQQVELLTQLQKQQQQQQGNAAGGTPDGTSIFQFPLWLYSTGQAPGAFQVVQGSKSSNSATSSPTPSTTSSDSGISDGHHTLALPSRRPLSESQSAPGVPIDSQQETVLRSFLLQNQQLQMQKQKVYQQYLDHQQKLMQQAILERQAIEEQQRQLATLHLRQQTELQQKHLLLLRQLQELQRQQSQQQALLMLQAMQQQAAAAVVHRVPSSTETLRLPFGHKTTLTQSNSLGSVLATPPRHHEVTVSASMEMSSLNIYQNRSPTLTPKLSLTPTNSHDSTASNGRSSPHVGAPSPSSGQETQGNGGGTGLVYDTMMLKHSCTCGGSHPEHPGRLQSIWARLVETKVVTSSRRLRARKASLAELQALHSDNHVKLYGRSSQRKVGQDKKDPTRSFIQMSCQGVGVDQDTYWNEQHTSNSAKMAVGSVIELADKVVTGEVKNGFAFVRPPGHHALPNQAMGFCYFNNVALAAKAMLAKNKRVMIVDWDIHHGNGTQQIFYDNPGVLYLSLHRYDNGTFFPGTGRPEEIGSGAGLGFNINVAFSGPTALQGVTRSSYGDAEYLAAFRCVVVPVAREFSPDIILVSAGFNATEGHPPTLGGYTVTAQCYAHMTRMLMSVGNGRVAMALEGGYELMSLCASAEACMKALLGLEVGAVVR
jgi:acetoin utilization deacetylase AcuC-like enzyme